MGCLGSRISVVGFGVGGLGAQVSVIPCVASHQQRPTKEACQSYSCPEHVVTLRYSWVRGLLKTWAKEGRSLD